LGQLLDVRYSVFRYKLLTNNVYRVYQTWGGNSCVSKTFGLLGGMFI
jgi:hypothetical protein